MNIRKAEPADQVALERMYPAAFPDEDLLPLLADLAEEEQTLSLVATDDSGVAGHVAFTLCDVVGTLVGLLAPLAVDPARQRQGIGSALVRDGLQRLADAGIGYVVVLGDPAYYGRFGFSAEASIKPPFELPEEWQGAWQSLALNDSASKLAGPLSVPPAWNHQALWAP